MSKTHQQTSNNFNSSSLAAAFTAPVLKTAAATPQHHQEQEQSKAFTQNNNNNHFVRHNSSQSDCDHYYYQEQQEQQQDHDCQSTCSSSLGSSQQGQQLQVQGQHQQLQGPTFVSVFPSVKAILPHHNSSAKGQVPWSCSNCRNPQTAFGHKCQHCHKSRDAAALRVFMGQLTKEGDVQLIHRMLEVLCPQLDQSTSLLHIEPHTHANTGRGKGCAWVYVRTLEDVLYLVERLHKRTYPTVNAETGEVGFVAFPDSFSNEEIKDAFDNDITFLGDHVVQLFHRSPITAEVPLSLQRALNLPSGNNNKAQQQQQQQVQHQHQHQHNHVQNNNNNSNNNNNNNVNIHMNRQQQQQPQQQSMQVVAYSAPTNNNLNNTIVQQQQEQEQENINNKVHTTSPFKRYRWNPYSSTSARVPVRC